MIEGVDALIVAWDFTHGKDKAILLVGKQVPMKPIGYKMEIINAFQGPDAEALYQMLTEKKEVLFNGT